MYPELFRLPIVGYPIKSYGFMLMVGFLTAIWFAMRRAERVKGDPDLILNLGFVALICGVVGARVFYVAHYWKTQFAPQPNPLLAAINLTAGGLEYYGGLLCAIAGASLYLAIKRASWRMYMDIVAPSVMLGLAFGRLGCLLNGCCWGGLCVDAHNQAALPWAVQFPFSSPAYMRQWEERRVTAPAELLYTPQFLPGTNAPLARELLSLTPEERFGPIRQLEDLEQQYEDAKAAQAKPADLQKLQRRIKVARDRVHALNAQHDALHHALRFASRTDPSRTITYSELQDLAAAHKTLPVHPAQLYGIVNALILSLLLSLVFYRRQRHGVVMGVMLVLYPISRIILEVIRTDNPHDSFGVTISQAVSIGVVVFGILFLVVLYRYLPLRSPRAVPFVPPSGPAAATDGRDTH